MNLTFAHLRWLWLPVMLAALLLIRWSSTVTPVTSAVDGQPPLLAFYYGWFDEQTWTSGLSPDLPLEPYRSSDPAVIARHVRQAREAGIEGFLMSWYGPQVVLNQTETNFRMLLDEAQQQGFTAAVDFETRGPFFPDRDSVVAGLRYLLDTHTQHPAYLRIDGKPVVFFWQQNRFTVSEWESIRQEVDPDHTSLWIAEGTTLSYQFQFDGHHLYNIAWANDVAAELTRWRDLVRWFSGFYGLERYWVATTMPGFDERHLDRASNTYRPRGTGEFYIESWQAAMATEPDILIITSFNEWLEDSQIEPSVAYGNYYLDLTHALRNDEPFPPTPIPSPSPTPGRGSIIGLVTDAVTGNRLVGVTVSVDGQIILTNGVGLYRFDNVPEGLQVAVASFPSYLTAQKSRVVVSGELVWNSIAMTPAVDSTATATPTVSPTPTETTTSTPIPTFSPTAISLPPTGTPAAGTGTLIGLTTNVDTGQALVGVAVSANGQVVLTDSRGIYILAGLPLGEQLVSAQHPDFQPAAKVGFVVANTTRWNSFAMAPLPTPAPTHTAIATPTPTATLLPTNTAAVPSPTIAATNTPIPTATTDATSEPGSLMGLITNVQTGERLAGVVVSTEGGSMQTQENGFYLFENLPPGSYIVSAEHPDFQPAQQTGLVVSNEGRWNSIALTPREQPMPTDTPTVPPSLTTTATPLPTATSLPSATPTQTTTVPPSPTATATALPTATPTATSLPSATPTKSPFGALAGIITDAETGDPLADATVSVAGQSMVTDEQGAYRFEAVPEGLQVLTAEKDGYQPGGKSQIVVANEVRLIDIELTKIISGCPTSSEATFDLIPIQNPASEPRPDHLHGDLNLAQRGYSPTDAALSLQDYTGGADPNAPQLAGLFEPNSFPGISTVYRVNHWDWSCGEHGCRGEPITDWPVTLIGLPTTPGQAIHIPERTPEIFGGEFKAMVLYAEEQRITLGYTRDDTVAPGYAVHIENVCVDPNLLALYRAQNDKAGFRATNLLPALHNHQKLGTAFNSEIQVAIRDRGAFMDPRSRKDWWQGF